MAEGRMLNRSVGTDERLNGLSHEAMLLYLMTIPHLDRDGLVDGRPRVLWASVAPLQDAWLGTVEALIAEWLAVGLAVRYAGDDGKPVLFFPGFAKNQKGLVYRRERASRFACPPGMVRAADGLRVEGDGSCMQNSGSCMQNSGSCMQNSGSCMQNSGSCAIQSDDVDGLNQAVTCKTQAVDGVCPREDQYQTEDQVEVEDQVVSDGDGDHHALTHRVLGMGGSAEGGAGADGTAAPTNGKVGAGELVYAFTVEQLRSAAYELGALLGLHTAWTNYAGFLGKREPGTLAVLLEWLEFYGSMPEQALAKIDNLPGLIRSHLNKGERAPLTGVQRTHLGESVVEALAAAENGE